MDLYQVLADAYETVFPTDPDRVQFCLEFLEAAPKASDILAPDILAPDASGAVESTSISESPRRRFLDAGCGTGELCRAIARVGHRSVGFDSSDAMISAGRRHASAEGVAVDLQVAGLLDLATVAAGRTFDLITCLGNTVVHLPRISDVGEFVDQAAARLSGGRAASDESTFVVQLLNYDRILARRPETLPDIRRGRYLFERRYEYSDDGITFHGTLTDTETRESWKGRSKIQPYRRGEVEPLLAHRFHRVRCLGDLDGSAADADSFVLTFVARSR